MKLFSSSVKLPPTETVASSIYLEQQYSFRITFDSPPPYPTPYFYDYIHFLDL